MIKRPSFFGLGRSLSGLFLAAGLSAPALAEIKIESDGDKIAYAVGYNFGTQLAEQVAGLELSDAEKKVFSAAIDDALNGAQPRTDVLAALQLFQQRMEAEAVAAVAKNGEFLAEQAKAEGAEKTESGLIYSDIKKGDGPSPKATDTVSVHYQGTFIDGAEFDSSYKRGEPAEFPLNGVIACWTEGVQKMKVGGKAKLICPPDIAYGDGRPGIPPNSVLVFEVELLGIK